MRSRIILAVVCLALATGAADLSAQSDARSVAIRATALDYIEGWYEGSTERMTRALHPRLVKRIVDGAELSEMTAAQLIAATRRGGGKSTPVAERRADVRILDVYGNSATVRVDARDWVDYLQMSKINGRWVIVNVLWEERR